MVGGRSYLIRCGINLALSFCIVILLIAVLAILKLSLRLLS
jgi:hypothetical protein